MRQIQHINEKNMKERRKHLIDINKLRGKKNLHSVSVQMDGMYNSRLYAGVGRTPFQPATQTIYTVAENETTDHNILSINTKNKLCSTHSSLEIEPDSGRLHNECTNECSANIPMVKSIGDEYSWAKECLLDLKKDGIEVDYVVTDPDSSAYKAAKDLFKENVTKTEPEHFIDTRHLSENFRKGLKKEKNLLNIMPARTQLQRQKLLNTFATDLAERCNAEVTKSIEVHGGDFRKIRNKISYVVDAIANCYMQNHTLCRKHSFVCQGSKRLWLNNRPLSLKHFKITNTNENLIVLRKFINKRLGPKTLERTRMNMNTNFVEGFNRSLRRSIPSNVTFKKNVSGRAHSAVHSVNFGPGESILELCSHLHCEIPIGSSAYKALKSIQKIDIMQKQHKKSVHYRQFRSDKRQKLYKLYEKLGEIIEYEKNMLLADERERTKDTKKRDDHSYGRNDKRRTITVRK